MKKENVNYYFFFSKNNDVLNALFETLSWLEEERSLALAKLLLSKALNAVTNRITNDSILSNSLWS